jgi:hypothetical protein
VSALEEAVTELLADGHLVDGMFSVNEELSLEQVAEASVDRTRILRLGPDESVSVAEAYLQSSHLDSPSSVASSLNLC